MQGVNFQPTPKGQDSAVVDRAGQIYPIVHRPDSRVFFTLPLGHALIDSQLLQNQHPNGPWPA